MHPETVAMTTRQVATHVRVSMRQLDYWVTHGYLPVHDPRPGSGSKRLWTAEEVHRAEAFAALVHAGVEISAAAEAMPHLVIGLDGRWFASQLGALTVTGPLS